MRARSLVVRAVALQQNRPCRRPAPADSHPVSISFMEMNGNSRDVLHFAARAALVRFNCRAHAPKVELFHVNRWRMRPCQGSSKLRRQNAQAKPPPSVCWVPPDWVFRWSVTHPHPRYPPLISRKPTIACPISASFLAKRKWLTSASPRSISSTGKTLAAAASSSPADAVAAAAVMVAAAVMAAAAVMVVAVFMVVAVAEVAAGAAAAVAAGSESESLAVWVASAARAAASPGACAACVRSHDLTSDSRQHGMLAH